jgi:hypothetical protein
MCEVREFDGNEQPTLNVALDLDYNGTLIPIAGSFIEGALYQKVQPLRPRCTPSECCGNSVRNCATWHQPRILAKWALFRTDPVLSD